MDLPTPDTTRWLVSHYARFLAEHGEAIGRPELVLPTGDFFPDEFSLDPDGVMRVAKRVLAYAPVSGDLDVKVAFFEAEEGHGGGGGCGTGGCGSGGCGGGGHHEHEGGGHHEHKGGGGCCGGGGHHAEGVEGGDALETEEGYAITLGVRDAGSPVLLTTALARGAGAIVLSEAGQEVREDEIGAMSELAASAVGFGALLTSGAYVYGKSCGGVNIRQATHLSLADHALLLALFCRVNDHKPSAARAHFGASQKEALDAAVAWVDSNVRLVDALRQHPESLVDGVFPVEETKGILGRLFAKRGPRAEETAPAPAKTAKPRSEAEQRRLEEAKALVEDALRSR